MKVTKKHAWLALAGLLSLGALSGCGQSGVGTQADTTPTLTVSAPTSFSAPVVGMSVLNPTGRTFRLGAKLTGRNPVNFDGGSVSVPLPAKTDLRTLMSPVADQGAIGSCTAFSIIKGLREFLLEKQHAFEPLSAGFFYYKERESEGSLPDDGGATIETGMNVLKDLGTTTEADFPYATETEQKDSQQLAKYLAKAPTAEQVSAALKFRVTSVQHLSNLTSIKQALAAGTPVSLGIRVFESFGKVGPDGMVPMPQPGEKLEGGHAVAVTGYDNARKVLIVKNSWGADWGDHGYFYLPFDYVKKGYAEDAWTAK